MEKLIFPPTKLRFEGYLDKIGGKTKTGKVSKKYGKYLVKCDLKKFNELYKEWEKEEWKKIQENR